MLWLVSALIASMALAACGGGDDDEGADPTSTQPPPEPTATATPEPTATPTVPPPTPTQPADPSGQGPITGTDPCDTFDIVGSIAGAHITGQTSESPQSDMARELDEFFQGVLEESTGGDVSSGCFFEVTSAESSGVWISLTLPGEPGQSGDVRSALEARGATVAGTFNASADGMDMTWFALESLPVDGTGADGAMLYVLGSNAVVIAGQAVVDDIDGGMDDPAPTVGPGGSGAPGPAPTEPSGPGMDVTPSGIAAIIDGVLQPQLEEALGTDLEVQSSYETSAGGVTSVSLVYESVEGEIPVAEAELQERLEGLGATVTSTVATGDGAMVSFEGLQLATVNVSGVVVQSPDEITVSLQIQ
ncbi:MAG: hypothetical protein WD208_13030 [Dehalococcoidia bacterium]